eukprot:gb/GECH01008687.1/.p1 GENE.gb/GECH01008687.1/~~gb/GECH01008687.1/.p1  ORF type:complete len:2515 (+),score=364.46 gb/GECH01008687.1/:1-7545(+)
MTSLQPQDNNSRFLTSQAHNRDPTRPDSLKVSGNVNEGVEFEGMSLDQKQQVERLVLHGEYVILNRCNCQVRNDLMFVANYKKQHQGQEYGAKILNTVLEASSIKILSSHENACIHMENTHLKSNQEDILIECKGDVTMGSFESMKNVTIVSTGTVTLNGDGLCKGSCQIYGNDIYVSGSISGVGDVELMASNEITVDGLITSEIGINFQSNNRLVLNGNLGSNAVILNTEGELRHTNYLFTSYQLVIAARTMKKQGHIHCNGNQVVGVTEQIDNETGEWHSKGLSSINAQRMNSHAKIESELTLTLSVVHLTNFDLIEAPTIGFDSLEKLENQPNGKLCCEFIEGWDRRERKLINDGVIEVDSVVLGLDYNQTKTGRLEATRLIIDYQFENKGKCAIEKGLIIGEKSLTKNHGMITASSVNTSKRSKATFENSGTFQVKEESVISGYMIINRGEIYSSDALSVFSSHGNFLNRGRVLCEKDFKLRTKESCLYGEIDIRGDLECIVREKMYVDCRQFNVGGDFSYFGPETTFNNLYQKEGTTICVGGNFNINVAYFFSNGIINAKKNDNSEINKLNIKQWIQSKPSQIQAGKEVCIQVLEKGELDGRLSADKITFLVQGRIEGTNLLEGDEIYASIGQPHEGCTSFHANNAELHLNGTKVNSSTYFRGENAQVVNHGTHEGVSFANVNNHYSHTIHGDQLGSIQGQGNGLFNFQVGGRSVGAVDTSFDRIRAFLAENIEGKQDYSSSDLILSVGGDLKGDLTSSGSSNAVFIQGNQENTLNIYGSKKTNLKINGITSGNTSLKADEMNVSFRGRVDGTQILKSTQLTLTLNEALGGRLKIQSDKSNIQLNETEEASLIDLSGKTCEFHNLGDSSGKFQGNFSDAAHTTFNGQASGQFNMKAPFVDSTFENGIQSDASIEATTLLLRLNDELSGNLYVSSKESYIKTKGTSKDSIMNIDSNFSSLTQDGIVQGSSTLRAIHLMLEIQDTFGGDLNVRTQDAVLKLKDTAQDSYIDTVTKSLEVNQNGTACGKSNFNCSHVNGQFSKVSGNIVVKAIQAILDLNDTLSGNLMIESGKSQIQLRGSSDSSNMSVESNHTSVVERGGHNGKTIIDSNEASYTSMGDSSGDVNMTGNNITTNFFGECSGNISVDADKSQSVFDKGIQGNASFNATQLLLELNQLLDGQVTVHSDQSSIVLNGTSSGSKLSAEGKDVDIRDHGKNKGFVGVEASNNFIYQNDQGNEGSIEAKAGGKIEARIKGESSGSTNFNAKNIEAVFDGIVSGENKMKAENLLVKLNSMLKGNLEIESDNGTVILNGTEKQSRIHATGSSLSILDKGDHRGSVEAVTDNYFHQINGNQSGSVESRAKHTNELQVSCNSNGKVDLKGRDAYLVVGKNRSGETNMYSENNSIVDAGGNFYFNGNIRGDNTAQIKARNIYDNGKTSSRGLVYKKADSIRDTSNAKTKSKKVYVESNDSGRLNGYYEASNLHIKRKDYTLDNLDNLNSEHIHLEMNSDKIIDKPIFIGTNRLLELSVKSLKNNASIHGDFVARTKNDFKNNGLILGDNIQLEVGGTFFERGTTHGRQNQYTEADYIDFEKVEQNDSRKTRHERRVWEDRNNVSWICRKGDLDFRNSEHDISGNLIMKARGDIWLDNETYQVQKTHDSMTDFSVSAINANKINIDSGKKVHGSGINMHGKNGIDVKGKDGVDMESLASTYISDRWSYREGFLWHRKKEGFRESVNYRGVYMSSSNGSVNVHAPEGSINTRGAKVAANASSTWSAEGNINWDAKKVSTNAQTSTSSCYGLKKSRTSSQTEHGTTFEGYIGNKINAVSSKGKVQAEGAFIHAEQGGKIYGKQGIDFKPLELNHKFKYREGGVKFGHFGSGGISSILPPFMTKMKDLKENQDGTTGAFSDAMGAGVQAFNATKGLAQASISNTPLSWINHQLGLLKFSVGVFKKSHEMNTHEERPGILSTGKNASLELNTGDYGSVNLGTNVNVNDVTFDTPEVNLQGCKTTIESSSRSFSADIGFNPLTNLLYPSSIGTSTQKSHSKQTNQIHTQFKANNMHFKRNKTRMNIQGCSAHVNNTSGGEVDVQEEDMQDEHTETRAGMSWNIGLDMGSVKDIGYGAHFSNTCEKKTQNSTKLDVLNAHSGLRKKEKITKTDTTQGGGFGFHYTHDISDATGESKNTAQDIKVPISVNAQCKGMRMRMEIPELWKTDEIRNGFQTIKNAATFDQNQLPSRQHNYGSNIAALYADTLYKINLCRGKTKEYAQRLVTETVESQNSSSSHPNIQKNVTMSQHQAQCQAAAQVAYEAVENKGNSKDLFKDAIKKTPKLKGYEVAESNRDAFVLVNKETKKAIYAIRGTHWGFDGDCVRDVYCNISYIQANRSLPRSITHEKLFRKFAEQHPDYDFTVTGHSLGGRVAADIALNTGVRAEIFNAAGTKFGDIGNDFTDQEETLQFLEKAYKNGKNITSHILQNDDVGWDFVPKIGHQPTDNIRLYDTPDKTHGIILFGSFAPK